MAAERARRASRGALAAGLALLALAGGVAFHAGAPVAGAARAAPAALAPAPVVRADAPAADALPVEHAVPLRTYPHDRGAFTEGLFIDAGQLYESTGEPGRSGVRRVDLVSGRVLEQAIVPAPQFGEGIAPWRGQIISLTWRDGVGYRWARQGLAYLGRFNFIGEGWGMTRMGDDLVMSDGSASLQIVDPATFRLKRRLPVTASGVALDQLNELEWVDGEILANVWQTDRIARIDPATGHVVGWIDLAALHRRAGTDDRDQVANGIAWDAPHRRLYVTGKEWPFLFEIAPPKGR